MAEAAVEGRFFCHKCTEEISPLLPDYICPRCRSGFIEEMAQGADDTSEADDEDVYLRTATEGVLGAFMESLRLPMRSDELNFTFDEPPSSTGASTNGRGGTSRSRRPHWAMRGTSGPRRNTGNDANNLSPLEGLLQHILTSLAGGGTGANTGAGVPIFFNLHGNPGDYAWGRGGLDAIITQLLNQLDGSGPPPLPTDKISVIPKVRILKEQVDKNLQCTVCMEDFKVDEEVRQLECQHHFHDGCIVPWLELHATCPICRKSLIEDGGSNENDGDEEAMDTTQANPAREAPNPDSNLPSTSAGMSYSLRQRRPTGNSQAGGLRRRFVARFSRDGSGRHRQYTPVPRNRDGSSANSSNNQPPSVYDFTDEYD